METKNIEEFFKCYLEYFDKRRKLINGIKDLDYAYDHANFMLNEIIDNGLDVEFINDVANAYVESKFNSNVVKEFIHKVSLVLFGNDDALKDDLEIVSIEINRRHLHSSYDEWMQPISPISIKFLSIKTRKCFLVSIPIKSLVKANLIKWKREQDGLYSLSMIEEEYISTICSSFDPLDIKTAICGYLDGKNERHYAGQSKCILYNFGKDDINYTIDDLDKHGLLEHRSG